MGFWRMAPPYFEAAVVLLLIAFAWLLYATLVAVMTTRGKNETLTAIRYTLASLLVTVLLGATLAGVFAWAFNVPLALLVRLHVAWGLIGWVALLVIGVAYQVVPMFQVTPVYPAALRRWLSGALFALLVIWSAVNAWLPAMQGPARALFSVMIAAALAIFGVVTLRLIGQRKRPVPDPTTLFWRIGLFCLLLCAIGWITGIAVPAIAAKPFYPLLLGILFIAGFAYSIVNGMLYKIVPFLVWYHLQSGMEKGQGKAPNVKKIVTDQAAQRQCMAHLVALMLLVASVFWPQWFARLAGAAFAVSSLWLWINLLGATLTYRRVAQQVKLRQAS
jgi:hypothetical protein